MRGRLILFGGLAVAALVVSGCHGRRHFHLGFDKPLVVGATLTCPAQQGHLTRVSASADGKACAYRGGDQDEDVSLTLTSLNGQPASAALTATEANLRQALPLQAAAEGEHHARVDGPLVQVDADDDHGHDKARVDVPFVHVDADGDKAHVKVFGVNIDADNGSANINTHWGSRSTTVKAGPDGAEIRTSDTRHGAVDLIYILASDQPGPGGYHTVGYIARGPSDGPLVVATFKSRTRRERHFHDEDLDQLLRLNVHS